MRENTVFSLVNLKGLEAAAAVSLGLFEYNNIPDMGGEEFFQVCRGFERFAVPGLAHNLVKQAEIFGAGDVKHFKVAFFKRLELDKP